MPDTRVELGVYPHEFSCKQHETLLLTLCRLKKTQVMLCGYRNQIYDSALDGWRRADFKTKSYAGPTIEGRKLPSRTLSLWMNYEPPSK